MQTNAHLSVLLTKQAEKYGDREFLIYKDYGGKQWKSFSWKEADRMARLVSNAMIAEGVEPLDKVAIFSQNSKEYIFTDFGAWAIRVTTIPFYATCSEQQVQFMANDAKVKLIFVGEQEQYDKAHAVFSMCPTLARIIVFDRSVRISSHDPSTVYFDEFVKKGEGDPYKEEIEKRLSEASMDELANILYTSGTTGNSKGVMLTHGQYYHAIKSNGESVPVREDDRIMNFLPFAHIFEKGWTILCISVGATLIVNTNPKEVQQSMRETHPTCMSAVPRFWEKVIIGVQSKIDQSNVMERKLFQRALEVGKKHNVDYIMQCKKPPLALHLEYEMYDKTLYPLVRKQLGLEKSNIFPTAGATVSSFVEEFIHAIGLNMVVGYGLTESLATVSCDHGDQVRTVGSVGRPISCVEVKISEEGEVLLKGKSITPGYYNRDDITRESFTEDGYFRTGDAGYMKDGELFLTDRIKDLFKTSNGKYIAPQMIESKLLVDKYIEQIAIIADQRKFVSALIVPVFSLLEEYARAHKIPFNSPEDLCRNKEINDMIAERIDTLQQQLASYEKVKRFTLMPHHFTLEKGELTNTLKLKRRVLNEHYKAEIDKMYEE